MTKKEKIFNDIVKDYDKSEHFSGKLCPDQYICNIEIIKNYYFNQNTRKNIFAKDSVTVIEKNIPNAENILILILESPHKDEFDKNGEPLGPANGTTGRSIREHIAKIFPNFSDYHLILMNAIPFQCSLGFPLSKKEKENLKRRDEVFGAVWGDFGKNFFKARLKKLLDKLQKNSKNVVIVNACTGAKDNSREPLCCKVCQSIVSVLENYCDEKECHIEFYHIHHPSTWNQINRTRNEKFWETDCVAVNPNSDDKSDEIEFNCKENKYWEKYLDTENLACSCLGKLEY